ncbi:MULTISPECIES: N-acyl homoserine lactonase family protein [Henriciella]|jgi:N-acyl homoserine lactone hydrolase|uniref:N-acyl homoserine lactonase family protein n=1 Tax=Henriciella TaxID=453849 RepID=UPI0035120BE0
MKNIALAAMGAIAIGLASCSGSTDAPAKDAETPPASEPGTPAPPASASAGGTVESVQLIKLDCGSVYVSDLDIFSTAGDYAGQTDTFDVTCWLIRHPDGDLLWDLGLPGILTSQDEQTTGVFTVSLDRTIADQLADLGLAMSDIEYLAVSHSHFDHVGQADLIDGSLWLVNQREYDYMFPEPEVSDETPDEAEPSADGADSSNQFPAFERLEYQLIPDNYDVFGDGSVIIFQTPGHTPGHSSLLVNLPETGPVMLTGDLWHMSASRTLKRVPQFNTNEADTLASMEAFEAKAAELGAKVIIQHEDADTDPLPEVMR